jgi:hypothetical protein
VESPLALPSSRLFQNTHGRNQSTETARGNENKIQANVPVEAEAELHFPNNKANALAKPK